MTDGDGTSTSAGGTGANALERYIGLAAREVQLAHRDDAKALGFDAGQDLPRDSGLGGVGFDDRECPFHGIPQFRRTRCMVVPISAGLSTT